MAETQVRVECDGHLTIITITLAFAQKRPPQFKAR
jgi:hypothetical protein